jgi:hypothetical protein
MENAPTVRACLWTRSEFGLTPVFAVERAREVLDHLIEWAEGDPSGWFRLQIVKTRHRYHVVLMPNLARSLERYRLARTITIRRRPARPDEYLFLFHPLTFSAQDRGLMDQIELRERMHLGIVDWADVDPRDLDRLPEPTFIGPFEVNPPDHPLTEYLHDPDET